MWVCVCCVCVECVLAWAQLSTVSWRRSDLWNPTVLIMVHVWETSNLPLLSLPRPLGYIHTLHAHQHTHTCTQSLGLSAPSGPLSELEWQKYTEAQMHMHTQTHHRHAELSQTHTQTNTRTRARKHAHMLYSKILSYSKKAYRAESKEQIHGC